MMKQERNTQMVYSKVVKAGRRMYFFDVKKTQKGELYLVVTESKLNAKKRSEEEPLIEKHRVMMFPEDFSKLKKEFLDAMDFIEQNNPTTTGEHDMDDTSDENILQSGYSGEIKLDIEF